MRLILLVGEVLVVHQRKDVGSLLLLERQTVSDEVL